MSDDSADAERPEHVAVRRLLAEARHEEPIPDDVAARMDRVLSGLSAERSEATRGAEVVPLALHRRRRATAMLVAAAAIVVGGVTLVQHLPGDSGTRSTAGGTTARDSVAGDSTGLPSASGGAPQVSPGPETQSSAPLKAVAGRVLVRPGHFPADALSARAVATQGSGRQYDALEGVARRCAPQVPDAVVLRATYEKAPAALVYHAPAGSTQVVDLYVCGSSRPVRSVTLPSP
ncbi:hypothetical protein [Nocardioides cynanchi]|uniref:hypothetical protein n=1 Tax=Nocardioides cynanchi TaxID=2558918 RepID=UPI0012456D11|nr:hypothetical protein [Nocardioides cynanchi]